MALIYIFLLDYLPNWCLSRLFSILWLKINNLHSGSMLLLTTLSKLGLPWFDNIKCTKVFCNYCLNELLTILLLLPETAVILLNIHSNLLIRNCVLGRVSRQSSQITILTGTYIRCTLSLRDHGLRSFMFQALLCRCVCLLGLKLGELVLSILVQYLLYHLLLIS